MKNKHLASQFPNIYRIITENTIILNTKKSLIRLPNQSKLGKFIFYFLILNFCILVLITSLVSLFLASQTYEKLTQVNKINVERQALENQISFWQSVLEKYPGYKDAYFRIALLEYRLGDFKNAKKNNMRALLLDPNYKDAQNLEDLIDKNY